MVPVHISAAAVTGESDRYVAVVTDLTQLRREEQAKDIFVSVVSHELRTPLTAIQGALSLLRAQAPTQLPEKARALIEIAHGNTERLLRIINDILDMEKIKAGRLEYDFREVVLGPLLEEAVIANQAYAEQFDVSIALGPVPPVAVVADAGRITQAITNLLSNGIKASRRDGCVVLDTRVGKDSVRIAVTDSGAGIPPAMRERIFDDFLQLETASDREKPCGTGLGLGIARSIVLDHGGGIDFVSEVGRGTTFFIDLPLAPAQESQADEGSSEVSETQALDRRRRIGVRAAGSVGDEHFAVLTCRFSHVGGADRHLARAAGNIEHVGRHRETGQPLPQAAHQRLPLLYRGPEMRSARRKVRMVEVVRLDRGSRRKSASAFPALRRCR